jgi:hypothetical protein
VLDYREVDHSFRASGHAGYGPHSLLVNDLELSIDEGGGVIVVDGYAPREGWVPSDVMPPQAVEGQVRVQDLPANLGRGMSVRLTSPTEWPSYFNARSGWLCVGNPHASADAQVIRIDTGVVLVVDGEELVAIWLPVHTEPSRAE